MGKKRRKAVSPQAATPKRKGGRKRVAAAMSRPSGSLANQQFVWSAKLLKNSDAGAQWSWQLSHSQTIEALLFLEEMQRLTWADIQGQRSGGRAKHHYQPIDSLCAQAQTYLSALMADDVDIESVFRFRVNSKTRLWGIVEDGVFKMLWYDPEHTVYPVSKKRT